MRAALYHRASPVDETSAAEVLARLQQACGQRGWRIVSENVDEGPWLHSPRPGLVALARAIRAGKVDVVVVSKLARLPRNPRHLISLARLMGWPDGGGSPEVHLLALEDGLDTNDLAGRALWRGALQVFGPLDREMRIEAAKTGRIRATQRRRGDRWGAPRAMVNPRELLDLYHGTEHAAPVSLVLMAKKLGIGRSTLRLRIAELREEGRVDEDLRARRLVERGGLPKGGRPSRAKKVDPDELLVLYQGPRALSLDRIARHYRMSRSKLAPLLEALRRQGRINETARAEAMDRPRRKT